MSVMLCSCCNKRTSKYSLFAFPHCNGFRVRFSDTYQLFESISQRCAQGCFFCIFALISLNMRYIEKRLT